MFITVNISDPDVSVTSINFKSVIVQNRCTIEINEIVWSKSSIPDLPNFASCGLLLLFLGFTISLCSTLRLRKKEWTSDFLNKSPREVMESISMGVLKDMVWWVTLAGWWLDQMILKIFSNPDDSMIPLRFVCSEQLIFTVLEASCSSGEAAL